MPLSVEELQQLWERSSARSVCTSNRSGHRAGGHRKRPQSDTVFADTALVVGPLPVRSRLYAATPAAIAIALATNAISKFVFIGCPLKGSARFITLRVFVEPLSSGTDAKTASATSFPSPVRSVFLSVETGISSGLSGLLLHGKCLLQRNVRTKHKGRELLMKFSMTALVYRASPYLAVIGVGFENTYGTRTRLFCSTPNQRNQRVRK
jgi:hypothetical protein